MIKIIAIKLIKAYQWLLSPIVGNQCRFHPTCSAYALRVFETESIFKASYLTLYRILRCQPFCAGGFDYPPNDRKS